MSVKHMILGALMENPKHGYEIKTKFFQKLFTDFGINDGQLYPTLAALEKDGLVRKEVVQQDGAPNRHRYIITDAGRRVMTEWLESSDGEERSFRYEFVRKDDFFLRCNFIKHLDKEKAVEKVERQIGVVNDTLADFNRARETMCKIGVDPLRIKILDYGIGNQRARLEWLKDFLKEIRRYDKEKASGACPAVKEKKEKKSTKNTIKHEDIRTR